MLCREGPLDPGMGLTRACVRGDAHARWAVVGRALAGRHLAPSPQAALRKKGLWTTSAMAPQAPPRLQEDRGHPYAVLPARVLVQKQPVLASSPRFPLHVTFRPSALTLVPRLDE